MCAEWVQLHRTSRRFAFLLPIFAKFLYLQCRECALKSSARFGVRRVMAIVLVLWVLCDRLGAMEFQLAKSPSCGT
jgi:hypothetical protein